MKLFGALLAACLIAAGCTAKAQNPPPQGNAIVSGHYVFQSQGWYNGTQLVDGGTMEADGAGHITQCSAGANGAQTWAMYCGTHWTVFMGQSDDGQVIDGRFGYVTSDQGDEATLACTVTGKVCYMTSHNVGWTWTARMEQE